MVEENPNKEKIRRLRKQGLSYGSIAKMFDLSRARIHQICNGYSSEKNRKDNFYILQRDNFECQWKNLCKGKKVSKKDLVIHHIDFNDRNNISTNLISLCRSCHGSFHVKNHIDDKIIKNLNLRPSIIRKCKVCKKEIKVLFSQRKTKKYCSSKCLGISQRKYKTKEGMKEYRRLYAREKYKDPKHREWLKNYYREKAKDPKSKSYLLDKGVGKIIQ